MHNVFGVLLAAIGLGLLVGAIAGIRPGVAAGGAALLVGSLLLIIDIDGGAT